MLLQQWVKTEDFYEMWKSAFSGTKALFSEYSRGASVHPRRYSSSGAIWEEVRKPFPGVQLVAVEIQPSVSPLALQFRV